MLSSVYRIQPAPPVFGQKKGLCVAKQSLLFDGGCSSNLSPSSAICGTWHGLGGKVGNAGYTSSDWRSVGRWAGRTRGFIGKFSQRDPTPPAPELPAQRTVPPPPPRFPRCSGSQTVLHSGPFGSARSVSLLCKPSVPDLKILSLCSLGIHVTESKPCF